MKGLEDLFLSLFEWIGFEATKIAFGDLFPGALAGFILAAGVGGVVSDWKYDHHSALISKLPLDWIASVCIFILSIYIWLLISIG